MALGFDLDGPFTLDAKSVGATVKRRRAGVYVLGELHPQGALIARYAGRSDDDLAEQLRRQAGSFTHFVYAYANSPDEAYLMECALYHEWSTQLRSQSHPESRVGSYVKCHFCGA
ncbi:MAG TPA: hypothetical protein VMU38_03175 [Candidatus Binatia bacterium]|nr:hypothetical protein [Candidatus Binatia bacterium]